MTWDELLALDEDALNLAIERLEGRVWQRYSGTFVPEAWLYVDPDGYPTYSTVPHLHTTASWDRTMALALRAGIEFDTLSCDSRVVEIRLERRDRALAAPRMEASALQAARMASCRRAICLLALWHAQQQEVPHADYGLLPRGEP